MPDTPKLTQSMWEENCYRAETIIRQALASEAMKPENLSAGQPWHISFAMGALVASAEMLSVVCKGGNRRVVEDMALAYVRGVIRGKTHPINADGSDYKRSFDA